MPSKGKARKKPQQHDDSHGAAPPKGNAALEQNNGKK